MEVGISKELGLVIVGVFILSFLLALKSLQDAKAGKEVKKVQEELKKGRVVYYSDSSESSFSSDSSSKSS